MHSWEMTTSIEQKGRTDIEAFLRSRERFSDVIYLSGAAAGVRDIQGACGDFVCRTIDGDNKYFDLKVEERWTGNLFLETWSNLGFNRGWLDKVKTDYIIYYFLNKGVFYLIDFPRLKAWAYGTPSECGKLDKYKEVPQSKHRQRNVTKGRLVPIRVIWNEVKFWCFCRDDGVPGGFRPADEEQEGELFGLIGGHA